MKQMIMTILLAFAILTGSAQKDYNARTWAAMDRALYKLQQQVDSLRKPKYSTTAVSLTQLVQYLGSRQEQLEKLLDSTNGVLIKYRERIANLEVKERAMFDDQMYARKWLSRVNNAQEWQGERLDSLIKELRDHPPISIVPYPGQNIGPGQVIDPGFDRHVYIPSDSIIVLRGDTTVNFWGFGDPGPGITNRSEGPLVMELDSAGNVKLPLPASTTPHNWLDLRGFTTHGEGGRSDKYDRIEALERRIDSLEARPYLYLDLDGPRPGIWVTSREGYFNLILKELPKRKP